MWRAGALALAFCLALVLRPLAAAAAEEKKVSFTVSEYAYKKLEEAHKLLGQEQYGAVRKILDQMAGRKLNEHERALVHQTYGYLESAQGHYGKAAAQFEQCLAQNALPPATQLDVQYNLAQLYVANEQFGRAATTLKDWFGQVEQPPAHAYYLLAVAYARQDQPDLALPAAAEAVQRAPEPREPWLQLLLSLYLEKKDYAHAADVLRRLLNRFPKKTYWMQLSAVYAALGKEQEALAVMQLAHAQGLLDQDKEIRNLAQMYLYHQIPYRAGVVLEKALADKVVAADAAALTLLADSWLSAREYERALPALERAAELSGSGELYVRLAQLHVDRERWEPAQRALRRALDKGDLRDRGRALLLFGICHASTKEPEAARRAFEQARHYEKSRKAAEQWLRHLAQQADG